jgi:hypothetical protein
MNMDLEEKIARAIYESRPRHPRAEWSTEPPAVRDGIRESARAVLSCLEENGMVVVSKKRLAELERAEHNWDQAESAAYDE